MENNTSGAGSAELERNMEILVILFFIGFIVIAISIGKDMYDVTETSREERRNRKK